MRFSAVCLFVFVSFILCDRDLQMHALAQSFDCHAMVSQRFYFKQKIKCSCHYAAIVLRVRFFVIVDLRRTSLHACDTQFAYVLITVLHAISLHRLSAIARQNTACTLCGDAFQSMHAPFNSGVSCSNKYLLVTTISDHALCCAGAKSRAVTVRKGGKT